MYDLKHDAGQTLVSISSTARLGGGLREIYALGGKP